MIMLFMVVACVCLICKIECILRIIYDSCLSHIIRITKISRIIQIDALIEHTSQEISQYVLILILYKHTQVVADTCPTLIQ
jgi:maltodextrin utilization protein YvdJ